MFSLNNSCSRDRVQAITVGNPGAQPCSEDFHAAMHSNLSAGKHGQPEIPILKAVDGLVEHRGITRPDHTHGADVVDPP